MDASASGFALRRAHHERPTPHRLQRALGVDRVKRNIGHRAESARAIVAGASIAHHAHDLIRACARRRSSNDFPIGFSPLKYCFAKVSLTIATAGSVSPARKSRPSMNGNLHRVHPARRDAQQSRPELARRRAVDRDSAHRSSRRSAAASRPAPPFPRPALCADGPPPGPRRPAAADAARPYRDSGSARRKIRWADATAGRTWRRTGRRRTAPENRTPPAAAISACISRRRECGSSPPFSALAGFTAEARSAGARPNRNVTPQRQRQAESQHPPVRRKDQARRIVRRIDHAHHERRGPPREQSRRSPSASNASQALSTSTSCTRRHRPAPIETRSAISRARAAACAVIRLATLAHAISSTSATRTPSATSDRR